MDQKKIGQYISEKRKCKNYTQKELAQMLGVTDKAVSKWERGAGLPDIEYLKPLAEKLEVSVNELLEGSDNTAAPEKMSSEQIPNLVDNMIDYADNIVVKSLGKWGKILSWILCGILVTGSFVSLIVDLTINRELTWSIVVVSSCILSGFLFVPMLLKGAKGIYWSLAALTILLIPFLYILEWYSVTYAYVPDKWALAIGVPNAICWVSILWICTRIVRVWKVNKWYRAGLCLVIIMIGDLLTNTFYVGEVNRVDLVIQNLVNLFAFGGCIIGCIVLGRRSKMRETSFINGQAESRQIQDR